MSDILETAEAIRVGGRGSVGTPATITQEVVAEDGKAELSAFIDTLEFNYDSIHTAAPGKRPQYVTLKRTDGAGTVKLYRPFFAPDAQLDKLKDVSFKLTAGSAVFIRDYTRTRANAEKEYNRKLAVTEAAHAAEQAIKDQQIADLEKMIQDLKKS